jgi:hypothetical protein
MTNRLIHDTFIKIMDEDTPMDDNVDDVHNVPLIDKAPKPIYEGSKTSIISFILMLVNSEVLNSVSNTCLT